VKKEGIPREALRLATAARRPPSVEHVLNAHLRTRVADATQLTRASLRLWSRHRPTRRGPGRQEIGLGYEDGPTNSVTPVGKHDRGDFAHRG
jgi:hypothetical protein